MGSDSRSRATEQKVAHASRWQHVSVSGRKEVISVRLPIWPEALASSSALLALAQGPPPTSRHGFCRAERWSTSRSAVASVTVDYDGLAGYDRLPTAGTHRMSASNLALDRGPGPAGPSSIVSRKASTRSLSASWASSSPSSVSRLSIL